MRSIKVAGSIPGPRSLLLAGAAARSVARPVAPSGQEVFIAEGRGAVVTDVDGNRFLDFVGGLGCLVVGHSHPLVVDAVLALAPRYLHTDYSVLPYPEYGTLAAALSRRCWGGKVAFFNSGAEAVENAVKVARAVTGRPGIACFEGAFHGRTNLTLALTHREVPYKAGFGPFAPEIHRLPYPGFRGATMESFTAAARALLAGHTIAAAVVEPELGEGGYVVPPAHFLPTLAGLLQEHGALLIADEIQSGYGRTGAFLASELTGIRPDLVTLGKSIAAGLPLSAVVGTPELMDALEPSTLGGTYVGNPLALAAGAAVLGIMAEEDLAGRARRIGDHLRQGWAAISAAAPGLITDVRGLGSMVGVEFATRTRLAAFRSAALQRGVLTVTAGQEGRVLRHLMPLVMTDAQLDEAFAVFGEAASAAASAAA